MGASAGTIRAGKAAVEAGLDDSALVAGLRAVEGKIRAAGARLSSMSAAMFRAGGLMAAPLIAGTKIFSDFGSALLDLHNRTGASVENLSQLSYAAAQTGASNEQLETAFRRMQKTLADAAQGEKAAAGAIGQLGLSVSRLLAMTPDEQFDAIGRAIASVGDPTLQAAAAMEVFGRSGTMLLPMLNDMDNLRAGAKRLGTMTLEQAKAADALGDAFSDAARALKQTAVEIGAALAPGVTDLTQRITALASASARWLKDHEAWVTTSAKVAAGVLAIAAASRVAATTAGALAGALTALRAAAGAAAAHPIIGVLAGLAAAGAVTIHVLTSGEGQQIRPYARHGLRPGTQEDVDQMLVEGRAAGDRVRAAQAAARFQAEQAATQLVKDRAAFEKAAQEDLAKARVDSIEDDFTRTIARINAEYEAKKRKGKELGADLKEIQLAHDIALNTAYGEAHRRRVAEESAKAKQLADLQRDLNDQIAREMIAANFTGRERQLALLGLEESEALRRAREVGGSEAKVRELFALRAAAIERAAVPDTKWTTAGTFSGRGASGLAAGGPIERIAAASEGTHREVKRLRESAKPLVFSP